MVELWVRLVLGGTRCIKFVGQDFYGAVYVEPLYLNLTGIKILDKFIINLSLRQLRY